MPDIFDCSGLYKSIEAKRKNAASFCRVDSHIHTIGSPSSDYQKSFPNLVSFPKYRQTNSDLELILKNLREGFSNQQRAKNCE
jgi:hypothetical protein